jgi:hypothetical protein
MDLKKLSKEINDSNESLVVVRDQLTDETLDEFTHNILKWKEKNEQIIQGFCQVS